MFRSACSFQLYLLFVSLCCFASSQAIPEWPSVATHLLGTSLLQQPVFISSYDPVDPSQVAADMPFSPYTSPIGQMAPMPGPPMMLEPVPEMYDLPPFPLLPPLPPPAPMYSKKSPSSDDNEKSVIDESIEAPKDGNEGAAMDESNLGRWNQLRSKSRSVDSQSNVDSTGISNLKITKSSPKVASYPSAYLGRPSVPKPIPVHFRNIGSQSASKTGSFSSNRHRPTAVTSSSFGSSRSSFDGKVPPPVPHHFEEWASSASYGRNQAEKPSYYHQWSSNAPAYPFAVNGLKAHFTPINEKLNPKTSHSKYPSHEPSGATMPTTSTTSTTADIRKPSGSSQRRRYTVSGRSPMPMSDAELYTSGGMTSSYLGSSNRHFGPSWRSGGWPPSNSHHHRSHGHQWTASNDHMSSVPNHFMYETTDEDDEEDTAEKSFDSRLPINSIEHPPVPQLNKLMHNKLPLPPTLPSSASSPSSSRTTGSKSPAPKNSADLLLNARPVQLTLDPEEALKRNELPVKSSRHTISSNNGDVTVVTETVYRGLSRNENSKPNNVGKSGAADLLNPSLANALDQFMSANRSQVNAMTVQLDANQMNLLDKTKADSSPSFEADDTNKLWTQSSVDWNGKNDAREMKSNSNEISSTTLMGHAKTSHDFHLPRNKASVTATSGPYGRITTSGLLYSASNDKARSEGSSFLAIVSIIFSILLSALLFTGCSLVLVYKLSVFKKRRFLCFGRRRPTSPDNLETNDAIRSTANLTKTNPLHSLVASGKLIESCDTNTLTKRTAASADQHVPCSRNREVTFRSNQRHSDLTLIETSTSSGAVSRKMPTIAVKPSQSEAGPVRPNDSGWIRTLKTTATTGPANQSEPARSNALTRFLGKMTGHEETPSIRSDHELPKSSVPEIAVNQFKNDRPPASIDRSIRPDTGSQNNHCSVDTTSKAMFRWPPKNV